MLAGSITGQLRTVKLLGNIRRIPWSENGPSKSGDSQQEIRPWAHSQRIVRVARDRYGGTPKPELDSPDKRSHSNLLPSFHWLRDHVLGSSEPADGNTLNA
jgi:hypothetical protein